jgi:hypothetical protein
MTIGELLQRLGVIGETLGEDIPVCVPGDDWDYYDDQPLYELSIRNDPQSGRLYVLLDSRKDQNA